jgi:hypothetical protein
LPDLTPSDQDSEVAADKFQFARDEQALYEIDNDMPGGEIKQPEVYTRPTFQMNQYIGPDQDEGWGSGMEFTTTGTSEGQVMTVMVIPDGTYGVDIGGPLDPAGCKNQSSHVFPVTSCGANKAAGPNGEQLRRFTMKAADNDDNDKVTVMIGVALYRSDGSAVIVSDELFDDSSHEPQLSFDEMTALALAMPDTPVE